MSETVPAFMSHAWRADLHAHTAISDGSLTPQQLIDRAAAHGVNLLAITDHDRLSDIQALSSYAGQRGVCLIGGIELSTQGEDEVHLLAYFVDPQMDELAALLQQMGEDRQNRGQRMLQKLASQGLPVVWDDLALLPGTFFGRPLLAQAMVRKGYVHSLQEAFDSYLGVGKPAYVTRLSLPTTQAIALLRRQGAVPVLAHPGILRYGEEQRTEFIGQCIAAGLMGIEAYHPQHTPAQCAQWDGVARRQGLLITGGSDFHDGLPPHGEIGQMLSAWTSCQDDVERLLSAGVQEKGH